MSLSRLDPRKPYLVIHEEEPDGRGGVALATTILLTASTCPIGCEMCDLHQNTLPGPTPTGAIVQQLEFALSGSSQTSPQIPQSDTRHWLKLYNSGNFFDPLSIRPGEYSEIAGHCADYSRVIVENHPRFGAERLRQFRDLLSAPLEVAVGLETIQPRWLDRLGKQMSRDQFDAYAKWLMDERVDLRVFLILGVPGISVTESLRWARLSVRHAIAQGARHVSLIPARFGHGWNGLADQLPCFSSDDLIAVQAAAIGDADGEAVVMIDLWDLDQNDPGYETLCRTNRSQQVPC